MAAENAIPTIDLTPLRTGSDAAKREVARQIDAACRDTGFFMVTGHGVPAELITTARQRAIDFFALPDEEKMKVQRPPAKISRGYNWVGDRAIAYSMGQATPPDIQEAFGFGQDRPDLASKVDKASAQMYAPNIWPERPHDFKQTMVTYYDAMMGLASHVLRAMAMALERGRELFRRQVRPPGERVPHHPLSGGEGAAAAGAAPRRHPHRLRHHDLRARRRHAGRPAGQASQRRLDRRAHPAERISSATSAT